MTDGVTGPRHRRAQKDTGDLVAKVNRADLKALFHVLVGRPDSIHKVLHGDLTIGRDDLRDLCRAVAAKLEHYHILGVNLAVDASFRGGTTKQFSSWDDFDAADWGSADRTVSLTLRWQFLVNLPQHDCPQKHVLAVRIAATPQPFHLLRVFLSGDGEEFNSIEQMLAPVICTVDFIDALLAQELVDLVEKWHSARRKPEIYSSALHRAFKYRHRIRQLIHYGSFLVATVVSIAAIRWIFPAFGSPRALVVRDLMAAMYWMAASTVGLTVSFKLGSYLGRKAEQSMEVAGRSATFELTKGDDQLRLELTARSRKAVRAFIVQCAVALLINLIATFIAAKLSGLM